MRVTYVPFLPGGRCAAIDGPGGVLSLPSGEVLDGEDWFRDTTLRVPLEQAGFRYQRVVEFGRDGDGSHLLAWIEGDVYRGRRPHAEPPLAFLTAEELAARLAEPGLAASVLAAAHSYRTQTDESFYEEGIRTTECVYLGATTVEGGSGFGGSPDEWRSARSAAIAPIDRDGTFLDVGCANGLLMESARAWCAERGLDIEPYGIDLAPAMVDLARRRLPHWADRIWLGNAAGWVDPEGRRFDTVHVLLESVPARRRAELVRHHLDRTVAPGGRLVAGYYGRDAAAELAAHGFTVDGSASGPGGAGGREHAWIDKP